MAKLKAAKEKNGAPAAPAEPTWAERAAAGRCARGPMYHQPRCDRKAAEGARHCSEACAALEAAYREGKPTSDVHDLIEDWRGLAMGLSPESVAAARAEAAARKAAAAEGGRERLAQLRAEGKIPRRARRVLDDPMALDAAGVAAGSKKLKIEAARRFAAGDAVLYSARGAEAPAEATVRGFKHTGAVYVDVGGREVCCSPHSLAKPGAGPEGKIRRRRESAAAQPKGKRGGKKAKSVKKPAGTAGAPAAKGGKR